MQDWWLLTKRKAGWQCFLYSCNNVETNEELRAFSHVELQCCYQENRKCSRKYLIKVLFTVIGIWSARLGFGKTVALSSKSGPLDCVDQQSLEKKTYTFILWAIGSECWIYTSITYRSIQSSRKTIPLVHSSMRYLCSWWCRKGICKPKWQVENAWKKFNLWNNCF